MSSEFVRLIDNLFDYGHPVVVRSNGGSMRPTIPQNALVRLEAVDSTTIRLGDVILYKFDEEVTVIHRVIRRLQVNGKRHIQAWGDNVAHPDAPVPLIMVKARVTAFQKNNEWIPLTNSPVVVLRWVLLRGAYYCLVRKLSQLFRLYILLRFKQGRGPNS